MAIHIALHHRTTYVYDRSIQLGPQTIRLRPAPHSRSRILSYSLKVEPAKHFINWQQDLHSNYQARFVFPEKTQSLDVTVDLVAEMATFNPFDFFLEPCAEFFPIQYEAELKKDLAPFLLLETLTPGVAEIVSDWIGKRTRTVDFLVSLNLAIHQRVGYVIRLEPGVQTPEETLKLGTGSCRDSAWLLVHVLRGLGFAARFVSGYLIQLKADQKSLDGPSGVEEDFVDLHAWCEVFLPGAGWVGLDPTSGLFADEGHIPLACTPAPTSAAPISGAIDKCESTMHHEMSVHRIYEAPRVTKPYHESEWLDILKCGDDLEKRLEAADVRLTMGGEPTFVSLDDPEGAEWNTTANGVRKRELAGQLIKRLRQRFAPGKGLLFYGQGKWYPGESLPRWSLECWWRKDGLPIWTNDKLIADESIDYGHDEKDAHELMSLICKHLKIEDKWSMPAYEDLYYYLWKERRLPKNVDVNDPKLASKEERERLTKIFSQGLGKVVGYVLPVRAKDGSMESSAVEWESGSWFLRDETLYLIPGDSPMGLRLPLDSLPHVEEKDYPWIYETDPSVPVTRNLPTPLSFQKTESEVGPQESWLRSYRNAQLTSAAASDSSLDAKGVVRTALCVEPRQGRLHIFLPPVANIETYLYLIAAIQSAVTEFAKPVILEGTPPPYDPRLNVLKVTPDPGVIEVNLHPASNWRELVENTEVLYSEARETRLSTEKFMMDGRHIGTGGGNHIILGGATPADSPLLRRPDLLKSLLGFWINHPSLSYLFSGLFIGPTSQAPRIDEARNDSIFELELAFNQVPEGMNSVPPWLVDRLFRNLLIDSTGNTHRSEFCIDKLFAPESSSGRLGLLELRSYEMPPHYQMSVAQQLLLRALVLHFWEKPYRQPLVRWSTQIHDKWMLPQVIWSDFVEVLETLSDSGIELKPDWYRSHFEFRFPLIGKVVHRGVEIELRHALEPWHVLGEEPAGGGTVRYVDSSLERIQVLVKGLTPSRYVITVNGEPLTLHPTGVEGEAVAGVRYRAWQPPQCLQPTIGVHSPLTFDLIDLWNDKAVMGCRYHVAHPGGVNYQILPVNAFEAESRRLSRFEAMGHSTGKIKVSLPKIAFEHPYTLDLRRAMP